ncbi:MAG: hypothetical protein R3F11_23175 [Verrucomicrobiales bacterium]
MGTLTGIVPGGSVVAMTSRWQGLGRPQLGDRLFLVSNFRCAAPSYSTSSPLMKSTGLTIGYLSRSCFCSPLRFAGSARTASRVASRSASGTASSFCRWISAQCASRRA